MCRAVGWSCIVAGLLVLCAGCAVSARVTTPFGEFGWSGAVPDKVTVEPAAAVGGVKLVPAVTAP